MNFTQVKVIGVDIGGTKIHAAQIMGNSIHQQEIVRTPSGGSESEVVDVLIKTISKVLTSDCVGIGIGNPSLVDSKKGIIYDTVSIPSWKEVHLKEILEAQFKIPVWVNNDANCFALGEKYFGKGKNYENFVGITLGTGLGSGIIINNKLYNGLNTGAGEIGSINYKDGIIEHYSAGQFFLNKGKTGGDYFQEALKGNEDALLAFVEFGKNLSDAIKIVLYAFDPEAIIIGGSISNAFDFFIPSVWKGLESYMYQTALKNLKIEKSELDNGAVLGAASLVYDKIS